MSNTNWSELSYLQLGRYAEYYAKMEFSSYGYDVYTSEVDDHGVDFVAKNTEASQPARAAYDSRQHGKRKSAHLSALQKYPRHIDASQPARGTLAPRQLRGSRAAIGSGGKKPCPF